MTWAELSEKAGGIVWPSPSPEPLATGEDVLTCESVTSILNTLYRFGLEKWKLNNTARAMYRRRDTIATMTEREAVQWATRQDNWARDYELSDTACGSEVHKALELWVLGSRDHTPHPEAEPFVKQFHSWRETVNPVFEAVECTVFDPIYLYAGTLDCIATIPGLGRYLIDYKPSRNEDSRGPYPEWALQLAAYRWAPYVCPFRVHVADSYGSRRRYYLSATEQSYALPTPAVDGAAILHIVPSGWRLYPVRVDEQVRDAFYYVRGIETFTEVIAKRSVFGSYLEGAL
jgi:hypothetical protein